MGMTEGRRSSLKSYNKNARNSNLVVQQYKRPCSPPVYNNACPYGMMSCRKTKHRYWQKSSVLFSVSVRPAFVLRLFLMPPRFCVLRRKCERHKNAFLFVTIGKSWEASLSSMLKVKLEEKTVIWEQCDQIARLFLNIWLFTTRNGPIAQMLTLVWSKFCQIVNLQ